MAGYFFEDSLVSRCSQMTLSNSGVDGQGASRCSIELLSSKDLDPANSGSPFAYSSNGIIFSGLSIQLEGIVYVNSSNCTNYPTDLDSIGNSYYPNVGFAGYIASIVPSTKDGAASVALELTDERWKWAQIPLPTLALNSFQQPGIIPGNIDTFLGRIEMSSRDVLELLEKIVRQFHRDFTFNYSILPNIQVGECQMDGNAYDFLAKFLLLYFGGKYQTYSAGAGHIEIVAIETNKSALSQVSISTEKLISNEMAIARGSSEDVDVMIGIGANRQYYLGDGDYDNELVPDWDWWNDGRILIIEKKNLRPAMYVEASSGKYRFVNPFDMVVDITDADKPIFLDTTSYVAGPGKFRFQYTKIAGQYPTLSDFSKSFEAGSLISKYCYPMTYGMDALARPGAIQEPTHNGRFRRFRLKDNKPRYYLDVDGVVQRFFDFQFFPLKKGKKYGGDPQNLNSQALEGAPGTHVLDPADLYTVNSDRYYDGYKIVILDQFLSNGTHNIKLMREKPGTYLTSFHGTQDFNNFIPIADEDDNHFIKQGPSFGPICTKYDLVQGNQVDATGSSLRAERVKVDSFQIVNGNRILFNEPQVITTNTVDANKFLPQDDAMDNVEAVNFYDPTLYGNDGNPVQASNGDVMRWFYMFRIGALDQKFFGARQILYPTRKEKPYATGINDKEMFFYQQSAYPLAIPRMELFCFVQYSDIPEKESAANISDFGESAYWTKIKSMFTYPRTTSFLNKRARIEYKGDMVIQEGGLENYTGDRISDKNKREIIVFYDTALLQIAEDFTSADKSLSAIGNKKMILSFQLRNDQVKFDNIARNVVSNFVPKGSAVYVGRNILPEKLGSNIFLTSVTHSFGNGWTTTITYGGQPPRLKDLTIRDHKLNAEIFSVLETLNNKNNFYFGVPMAQARRVT